MNDYTVGGEQMYTGVDGNIWMCNDTLDRLDQRDDFMEGAIKKVDERVSNAQKASEDAIEQIHLRITKAHESLHDRCRTQEFKHNVSYHNQTKEIRGIKGALIWLFVAQIITLVVLLILLLS